MLILTKKLPERDIELSPGDSVLFKSIDTIDDENETVNFTTESLNSLDISGIPPHNIRLKIDSLVILMRNLNPPTLCEPLNLKEKSSC
ncbi:ATP-dependent DNA helicase [Trichonephila clavipes]|nr:ATP-dependent DNA helicase [Trichonephila clavipes]